MWAWLLTWVLGGGNIDGKADGDKTGGLYSWIDWGATGSCYILPTAFPMLIKFQTRPKENKTEYVLDVPPYCLQTYYYRIFFQHNCCWKFWEQMSRQMFSLSDLKQVLPYKVFLRLIACQCFCECCFYMNHPACRCFQLFICDPPESSVALTWISLCLIALRCVLETSKCTSQREVELKMQWNEEKQSIQFSILFVVVIFGWTLTFFFCL